MKNKKIKLLTTAIITSTIAITSVFSLFPVKAEAYPVYSSGYLAYINRLRESMNNSSSSVGSADLNASIQSYSDADSTYSTKVVGVISKKDLPFSFVLVKNSKQAGIRSVAIDGKRIAGEYSCVNNNGWNSTRYEFTINDNIIENLSNGTHRVSVVLYDANYQNNTESVSFSFYLED